MQHNYNAEQAEIVFCELESSAVMQKGSLDTIKSILRRMGVECEDGLPKEVYISVFRDELMGNAHWIIQIFTKKLMDFLIEIWEQDVVELNQERWDYLQYLKIFGMITYTKGNSVNNIPNKIYVVQEMKDAFYFFLKGRKSKSLIKEYDEWEKIIAGLIYHYGLVEIRILYNIFLKNVGKEISYDTFLLYVKCRCSFWSLMFMLKDVNAGKEYFQYVNVENADLILLYIEEHPDLSYKPLKKEDLFYIASANGLDNRWKGVAEVGNILVDGLHMDYYQATVLVKTLIIMIQNSEEFDDIQEKLSVLPFESQEQKEKLCHAVGILFDNIPVFEYKGFSRFEYIQMFHQKQLKKRMEMFTIINGGRTIF